VPEGLQVPSSVERLRFLLALFGNGEERPEGDDWYEESICSQRRYRSTKIFQGCDLIIQILFGQHRKRLYVLIQVKNAVDMNLIDSMETETFKAFTPHDSPEDLKSPLFGVLMSLRGKKSGSLTGATKVVTTISPKRHIVMAAGLDDTLYPALEEQPNKPTASNSIVQRLKALLACTAYINVRQRTEYLKSYYPADDDDL